MRKLVLSLTFFVVCAVFAGNCFAVDKKMYNVGELCAVQASDGAFGYIKPCSRWSTKAGTHDIWITFRTDNAAGQSLYATAMAAFLNGLPVRVQIDVENNKYYYDYTHVVRVE